MDLNRKLMVRLSEDQHRALRVKAAELNVPMAEIVRAPVKRWLEGRAQLPEVVRRGTQV
jgi:hypothetical protein